MNTTITDASNAYVQKNTERTATLKYLEGRTAHRERQIKRLESRIGKLGYVSWVDEIVEPIAKEMMKHLPVKSYDILGPFGMSAEVAIHFHKNDPPKRDGWHDLDIISICIIPLDLDKGEIGIRDQTVDTGQYPSGTIGELNGMNHPTIPITPDMTIDDLVVYALKEGGDDE